MSGNIASQNNFDQKYRHDAHMVGVNLDEQSTDPQVIEFQWHYAQGGESGRGYHKNHDGSPAIPYHVRIRQAQEQQIAQELSEKGQDTSNIDLNQLWLMRKYGRDRD